MTSQPVEVLADRLVALRSMAWAGLHLLGAMMRDEDAEAKLDANEREEVGCYRVERHAVEDARKAMAGLQLGDDMLDGYETLAIGPTLDEFEAMQQAPSVVHRSALNALPLTFPQARLAELIARRGELGRAILYAEDRSPDAPNLPKSRHHYDLLDRAIRRREAEGEQG